MDCLHEPLMYCIMVDATCLIFAKQLLQEEKTTEKDQTARTTISRMTPLGEPRNLEEHERRLHESQTASVTTITPRGCPNDTHPQPLDTTWGSTASCRDDWETYSHSSSDDVDFSFLQDAACNATECSTEPVLKEEFFTP